jgi:hypothetical protein
MSSYASDSYICSNLHATLKVAGAHSLCAKTITNVYGVPTGSRTTLLDELLTLCGGEIS